MMHKVPSSIKFRKLQRRLGLPTYAVIGILESLWIATQENAPEGDIGRFDNETIAIQIDWGGDADDLISTLVETGWLDADPKYRLIVHDWQDHAPGWIKRQLIRHKKEFVTVSKLLDVTDDKKKDVSSLLTVTGDDLEATPNLTQPNLKEPDLTEPKEDPGKPDPAPQKKKSAFTSLPENFQVSERVQAWAKRKGFEQLQEHLEAFISKAKARGYTYIDWDEALMGAIREDWAGLRKPNSRSPPGKPSKPAETFADKTYTGTPEEKISWL